MIHSKAQIAYSSQLIVDAINNAKTNVPRFQSEICKMTLIQFQENYSTIKMSLQRQTGHTIAALQVLIGDKSGIIIVPGILRKKMMITMMLDLIDDQNSIEDITSRIFDIGQPNRILKYINRYGASVVIFDNVNAEAYTSTLIKEQLSTTALIVELQ